MKFSTCLALATLTGIASLAHARGPKVMPSPQLAADEKQVVTALLPTEASATHMIRPLNTENTIVYEQNFGGGGAGVGVLLGPLGVAANIAAIKGRTEKESGEIFGRLSLDVLPVAIAAVEAQGLALTDPADASRALIKPALHLISVDGENVQCSVSLFVDHNPAGRKWTGRYVYQLPPTFARSAIAAGLPEVDLEQLRQHIAAGFTEVARLYAADSRGELKGDKQVKFWSDYLSMRFDYQYIGMEIPGEADRLQVRMPLSVVSLVREQIRFTKPKKK
jgi:hypothetical protein